MTETQYLKIEHENVPTGCKIVKRGANKLQVDIDSAVIPELFFERLKKLHADFPVVRILEWPSKSGNKHVEVELESEVSDKGALFLQQFLGSDPIREYLSYRRIIAGIGPSSCFFKPKDSRANEVQFGA